MQALPDDYLPEWAKYGLSLVVGAGGVHWLKAILENRRLAKKEFRETLLERIRELEKVVASMQVRMGNLRVEMAHLEVENAQMRRKLGWPRREEGHAQHKGEGESDVGD